jgi:hypothetical protein
VSLVARAFVSLAAMCFVASLLAVGIGRGQGHATAGLTPQGLFIWNLDGLMRHTFGARRICWPQVGPNGCRHYTFAFKGVATTQFQLESKAPAGATCFRDGCSMGNFEVLRVAGRFVSCDPSGEWLGSGHGSGQIGNIYCSSAPPPADARVVAVPTPPSGTALLKALTPFGHDIWNLDALANDTLAPRTPCIDDDTASLFSVRQGGDCGPLSVFETYTYTFVNAFHSSFRLVAQPPAQAVHVKRNAPGIALDRYETFDGHFIFMRMKGRFISCGGGRWLGEGTGGSSDYSPYCARLR